MLEELEEGHDDDDNHSNKILHAGGKSINNNNNTNTQDSDDTINNEYNEMRELKYQYRALPVRIFFLYIWPHLNYFWLHIIYITFLSLFGGALVYWNERDNPYYEEEGRKRLTYIDASLSACSAATSTGLATIDFWGLSTGSQVIHLILTQLSSSVFIASMTAFIRRLSLSVWLSKHPQRECREKDNIIYCHDALLKLGLTLLAFNLFFILFFFILITIYSTTAVNNILSKGGVNPTWFSFFTVVCAFNQSGFALLKEGLVPLSNHFFFAFILSLTILVSNMFLPVIIRIIITFIAKFSKNPEPWKFMLEHPRICSTILFPSLQTKILAGCVTGFFTLQMVMFPLLNYSYPILKSMSGWEQFVVSFFQAANTMQAGFPVLDVSLTNTAQQWLYFIFMLVAVYPYLSVLRNTEVHREGRDFFHPDSLLKQDERLNEFERKLHQGSRVSRANVVWDHSMQHLKQTFLGDAFWLIFAVFLICFWEVIFEVASAYGGVGLSLGYPEIATGFSMIFSQKAKLVMMGVLILGRHRDMPRQRDVAVMQVEILAKSS